MRVLEEAGKGGVGGDLVVQEEAPVVAVRHCQFAVGQGKPVENAVLHFLIVVHQGIGLPCLGAMKSLLKQFEGKGCLTQLLLDDILVGSVEEVMVLERIVIVKVLSFVEVGNGLGVIPSVDDGGVCLVGRV